jgi:hypothetical protein
MAETEWFSFFREGVKLLVTMWNKQKLKQPVALFSDKPQNALWKRHIAVQKAKAARSNAHGHGVPFFTKLYDRALARGQVALSNWKDATLQFLQIVWFFLSSCFRDCIKQRAMAAQAMQWLQQGAAAWQWQPWYGILFRQVQARCNAFKQGHRDTGALPFTTQKPHQVVGEALQQGGADIDKTRGNSFLSPASQTVRQALHQIQVGNKTGFVNFR